ncbi:MAG: Deoxyribose-phosphate aldolase [Planctomycetes bacterium]|nr:Deoxyribose-phosphate aldolase [Planctomycetota bacterium]
MEPHELAPFLEHSVLRPDKRQRDVDVACDDALLLRFRGLVVPSDSVYHAKRRLMGSGIKVVSVVGFPHGTSAPDVKAHEATRACAQGADELDYVINVGAALDLDWKFLYEEAVAVMRASQGKIVKAILEVGYLPNDVLKTACATMLDAGVPWLKTCTGFGPGEARAEDVSYISRNIAGRALLKASGGVRTAAHAISLLEAGAASVGTSRGPEICGAR